MIKVIHVYALGALAALGLVYLTTRNAGTIAASVGQAINPANPDNIVNAGVSAVGRAIVTDPAGPGKNADGSWSLGGWLYDISHADPLQLPAATTAPDPYADGRFTNPGASLFWGAP